jgi:hypothetical protein
VGLKKGIVMKKTMLLMLLILAGCTSGSPSSSCRLPDNPDIHGEVVSVFAKNDALEGDVLISYQQNGSNSTMYVQVAANTSINDSMNTVQTITDIHVGDSILACREGLILESYPPRMLAKSIMIQR